MNREHFRFILTTKIFQNFDTRTKAKTLFYFIFKKLQFSYLCFVVKIIVKQYVTYYGTKIID